MAPRKASSHMDDRCDGGVADRLTDQRSLPLLLRTQAV
jgi:hypothetical protein